jgi:hypothetical protein
MIFTVYKIEITGNHILHISFAGKIYSKLEEVDNDCLFGVDLLEYNNFGFENKGKMNFKIQIVFEAGPDSRFRKTNIDLNYLIPVRSNGSLLVIY